MLETGKRFISHLNIITYKSIIILTVNLFLRGDRGGIVYLGLVARVKFQLFYV